MLWPLEISGRTAARTGCWFGVIIGVLSGCGGQKQDATFEDTTPGGPIGGGVAGSFNVTTGTGVTTGSTGTTGTGGSTGTGELPAGNFVPTEVGGYQLGPAVTGAGVSDTGIGAGANGCNLMVGVVRDFKGANEAGGHPDFEAFNGNQPTLGLVAGDLGADGKPVYASVCEKQFTRAACPYGQQTTSKAEFDKWYRFVEGENKPYLVYFKLAPNGAISTFDSKLFFPLDGQGWGNSGTGEDKKQHNFGFTTELHTNFTYNGGEKFSFIGDDDLWVFINGKLAIDLGGLHPSATGSVSLDDQAATLGITKGKVYPLELFHAERHTTASHFHIDTTLAFVDCGVIPPDIH